MPQDPMSDKPSWHKHGSKTVHVNPYWSLQEDDVTKPDGSRGSYFLIHANPFCAVIPVTKDDTIYLIKQYRYPLKRWGWEIPQGLSDGEELLVAANRELQEETGLIAKTWEAVGTLPSDKGATDEIGHIFVAHHLTQTGLHAQAEEGIADCRAFPLAEVQDMIRRGDIYDDFTIAALYVAQLHGYIKVATA